MSKVGRSRNYRRWRRYLAWLVIIVMLTTGITVPDAVFATRNSNWDVEYALGLDDGYVVPEEVGISQVDAELGQQISLQMNLRTGNTKNHRRFQEKFRIAMPVWMYDYLTENGTQPIEWSTEWTDEGNYYQPECGYILEEISDAAATDSNATPGNLRNQRASRSNTSASSSDSGLLPGQEMYVMELQFVEELRNAKQPGDIEIGDIELTASFMSPFLVTTGYRLEQDGYDCKLGLALALEEGGVVTLPFVDNDSQWNAEWILKVNGNDITPNEPVTIEPGVPVELHLKLEANTPGGTSHSFGETFTMELPNEIMQIISNMGFYSIKVQGKEVFTYTLDDSTDPGKITISFTDDMKELGVAGAMQDASSHLEFTMDEKVTITYRPKDDSSSWVVEKEDPPPPEKPKLDIDKTVEYIADDSGIYGDTTLVKFGDYVFYKITASAIDIPEEGYRIIAGDITDSFDEGIFEYVNLTDPDTITKLTEWKAGADSQTAGWIDQLLQTGNEFKTWSGDHGSYANVGEVTLTNEHPKADYYICLKVKANNPEAAGQEDQNYNNHVTLTDRDGEKVEDDEKVQPTVFYDAALTIHSTTKMSDGADPINMGRPIGYPGNLSNKTYNVKDGDLVTYRIDVYNQGNADFTLDTLSIYVPLGLELLGLTDADDYEDYRYALSAESGEVPRTPLNDQSHIYPELTNSYEFADEGFGKPFDKFYVVDRYTWNGAEAIAKNGHSTAFYITCRVRGIDEILAGLGIAGEDADNPDNRLYAERYGYLITAEVSQILDHHGLPVADEDSYLDDLPFNDWCNQTDQTLKSDTLWFDENGEIDQEIHNHVKSDQNYYPGARPHGDEDDYDYAVLYTSEIDSRERQPAIIKTYDSEWDQEAVSSVVSNTSNPDDYNYLIGGRVTELNTVIPYTVYINRDGSRTMNGVEFIDKIPETMELLKGSDGEPLFYVYEMLEGASGRVPVEMVNEITGDTEIVYIIDDAEPVRIKDSRYNEYTKTGNRPDDLYPPGGLLVEVNPNNGNESLVWDYDYELPDNEFSIKFGNIDNNAYKITYFLVVKQMSNAYKNVAELIWDEGTAETEYIFSAVSGGDGNGYNKMVKGADGQFTGSAKLPSLSASGTYDITYRIHLYGENSAGYPASYFRFVDYIASPEKVKDITGIKYFGSDGNTEVAEAASDFLATAKDDNSELIITNVNELESYDHYVEFTVRYHTVSYGSVINNVFGNTTVTDTPLKLIVRKFDAKDPAELLSGAEFKLYYTYENGNELPVQQADGQTVTITTSNGTGITEFHIDKTSIEREDELYVLYLVETAPPTGYEKLEDPIQLKFEYKDGAYILVSASSDENHSYEIRVGSKNEAELNVPNKHIETTEELPETGGRGTYLFTLSGFLLMLLSFFVYRKKSVRREMSK